MDGTPIPAAVKIASFKIDADEYERVEAVAERDERSVSAVLRLAVRDYLERHETEQVA